MVAVDLITKQRLADWGVRIVEHHATPVLLVAVGHDHVAGQVVVCTVSDLEPELLRAFLMATIKRLGG